MEEALIDWQSNEPLVLGGEIADLPEEVSGCVLFQSSGTSGLKKWIALSRRSLEWSARQVIEHLSITPSDTCGLAIPTHHVGGFGLVARSHFSGARVTGYSERWSAQKFTQWALQNKVTITSLVPTQISDLVSANLTSPSCLRVVVVGGGAFPDDLASKAQALGWPVLASYGMTETASQVATGQPGQGIPLLPGWNAKLVNDRLALQGKGLLRGYLINGEFTDPKKDGWFLTQDRVELDDRKITFLGRADRQVKILGELIDLDDLEARWTSALGRDLALTVRPDPRRGHSLWLAVTGSEEGVESFNASLPGPERIARFRVLENLPRSALGKINRVAIDQVFHL